ncbi:MAG: hypothetical protein IKW89_02240 [Bacteroidales bacterium]|nr:hypothetical protein [Bacteroidales bacterium]
MRKSLLIFLAAIFFIGISFLSVSCARSVRETTVDLRPQGFIFQETSYPVSTLTSGNPGGELAIGKEGEKIGSFTTRFTVTTASIQEPYTVLRIPGILEVILRQHDPSVWDPQNYPACPMPDGTLPVLEAALTLHSEVNPGEVRDMVVGVPLAYLEQPEAVHEVTLDFTGVRWSMYVDGILCDNDFTLGYPVLSEGQKWNVLPSVVEKASIWVPGLEAIPDEESTGWGRFAESAANGIQYWVPPFYNAWVGDVSACWYEGRYHLFYLFDRRGHGSKFGRGGHYFEHLSTADFRNWKEHEAATPIEEQWETFGTGTPFTYGGKLCLSYGLHTTRIFPEDKTNLPEQKEYLAGHGETGCFSYDASEGNVPAGTTWSVSEDGGETFVKSRMTVHPCENPSIFVKEDGSLGMLANYRAKGTWESDRLEGGWRCIDPDFPPGGDCTFLFSCGDWEYVVGGFVSIWKHPAGREDLPWQDMVANSEGFYDGTSVPSVTTSGDGRLISAGWLKMRNWAGALVIHELVPRPDGSIGSKWMEEIVPVTRRNIFKEKKISSEKTFPLEARSFILEFEVEPAGNETTRCSIGFLPEGGGDSCYLGMDLSSSRAQYSTDPSSSEKTLAEGCKIHSAGDYAVKGGMRLDRPFKVRIAVKSDPRFNGCIIDTEIAGERTMVTYRRGLDVGMLLFTLDGCTLRQVKCNEI